MLSAHRPNPGIITLRGKDIKQQQQRQVYTLSVEDTLSTLVIFW